MTIDRSHVVRAYLDGPQIAVRARDAATVIVVRDGAGGLETFLLHRPAAMAFAAGMYVFPGGSVDPADVMGGFGWAGPSPAEWARRLGSDETLARGLVTAAVRETFEECGVLLAGDEVGLVSGPMTAGWRETLRKGNGSLASLLAAHDLTLRSDQLTPWARWITPEFSPRRYDTRFFVAALPDGQSAREDGSESDTGRWLSVSNALTAYRSGGLPMMMVTASALRDLTAYARVRDLTNARRDLTPLMLRAVPDGRELRYVIDVDGVPVDENDFMADDEVGRSRATDERSNA